MTLPPHDESMSAADDAQDLKKRVVGHETASRVFDAAAREAHQVGRWLASEVEGTGPVRTFLSKLAEGYNKSKSLLIEPLPPGLEAALRGQIGSNETILVKLKGQYKEALVCTDQKVYVVKSGFMTGNTFGANVFQVPLANVDSIDVKYSGASSQGRFELLVRGGTSAIRSQNDAREAINCVTLYGPMQAQRFRNAGSLILEGKTKALSPNGSIDRDGPSAANNPVALLEKLADLYGKGLLTRDEFEGQKQVLLKRENPSL
jgi:hypothetical protein